MKSLGIEEHVMHSEGGISLTNEYADQIENLLSPLVGDLMAKMALKSQCKSLGILPEEIGLQHLEPLAMKIGFALGIHGHRDKTDKIVTSIKNMSSDVLDKRGKVKGTILSSVIEYVSVKWGAGLAQEIKLMTGHTDTFKPGTWHTIIMLESTLQRLENAKGQGAKSPSYDIGYQLTSNLKFDNSKFLFADTRKSALDTFSNIKFYFDINGIKIFERSKKEIIITLQEGTSPHLNQFLKGICDGILRLGTMTGSADLKESPGSPMMITVHIN